MTLVPRARGIGFEVAAETILAALRRGTTLKHAAPIAGVSSQAACQWLAAGDADPDGKYGAWAAEVRRIQAEQIAEAEELHRAIRYEGTNANAIQWFLERRDRQQYGRDPVPEQTDAEPLPDASEDDVARALGRG